MPGVNIGNGIKYKPVNIYKLPKNEKKPLPEQISARFHENQNQEEEDLVFL